MKTQPVATEPIVFERIYNAPIATVWKAITSKEDMKHWYFDIEEFKPEVGFEFSFVGGDDKQKYVHLCKVLEVIPEKKLKYSWRYEGYEGDSFVTWELFSEGKNETRVKLTHEGVENFPKVEALSRQNFVLGWTQIVGTSLTDYVEVSDIVKSIEINAPVDQVWQMLVTVDAVTNWAQAFGEGTRVESDFQKGSPVVWKSSEGQDGTRGIVSERVDNKKLVFAYPGEGYPSHQPGPEPYKEDFELIAKDGKTVLNVKAGPLSRMWIKVHEPMWDEALGRIADGFKA